MRREKNSKIIRNNEPIHNANSNSNVFESFRFNKKNLNEETYKKTPKNFFISKDSLLKNYATSNEPIALIDNYSSNKNLDMNEQNNAVNESICMRAKKGVIQNHENHFRGSSNLRSTNIKELSIHTSLPIQSLIENEVSAKVISIKGGPFSNEASRSPNRSDLLYKSFNANKNNIKRISCEDKIYDDKNYFNNQFKEENYMEIIRSPNLKEKYSSTKESKDVIVDIMGSPNKYIFRGPSNSSKKDKQFSSYLYGSNSNNNMNIENSSINYEFEDGDRDKKKKEYEVYNFFSNRLSDFIVKPKIKNQKENSVDRKKELDRGASNQNNRNMMHNKNSKIDFSKFKDNIKRNKFNRDISNSVIESRNFYRKNSTDSLSMLRMNKLKEKEVKREEVPSYHSRKYERGGIIMFKGINSKYKYTPSSPINIEVEVIQSAKKFNKFDTLKYSENIRNNAAKFIQTVWRQYMEFKKLSCIFIQSYWRGFTLRSRISSIITFFYKLQNNILMIEKLIYLKNTRYTFDIVLKYANSNCNKEKIIKCLVLYRRYFKKFFYYKKKSRSEFMSDKKYNNLKVSKHRLSFTTRAKKVGTEIKSICLRLKPVIQIPFYSEKNYKFNIKYDCLVRNIMKNLSVVYYEKIYISKINHVMVNKNFIESIPIQLGRSEQIGIRVKPQLKSLTINKTSIYLENYLLNHLRKFHFNLTIKNKFNLTKFFNLWNVNIEKENFHRLARKIQSKLKYFMSRKKIIDIIEKVSYDVIQLLRFIFIKIRLFGIYRLRSSEKIKIFFIKHKQMKYKHSFRSSILNMVNNLRNFNINSIIDSFNTIAKQTNILKKLTIICGKFKLRNCQNFFNRLEEKSHKINRINRLIIKLSRKFNLNCIRRSYFKWSTQTYILNKLEEYEISAIKRIKNIRIFRKKFCNLNSKYILKILKENELSVKVIYNIII